jgi:small-conductance mechanosensitive channel
MNIPHHVEGHPTIKRTLLKELGALLLFVVVGGALAMPCLCTEGAIGGRYKTILLLLVSLRLGWSIYRRTFRFRDYFIYFAVVVAFCLWTDSRF